MRYLYYCWQALRCARENRISTKLIILSPFGHFLLANGLTLS